MSTINERFGISLGDRHSIHALKQCSDAKMEHIRSVAPEVLIWHCHYESFWRPNGGGYTKDSAQAGIYTFDEAYSQFRHVDKSDRIELVEIKLQPKEEGG